MAPSKNENGKYRVLLRLTQVSPIHKDARLSDRIRSLVLDSSRPSIILGRASKNRGLEASSNNLWIDSPIITKEHARFVLGTNEKEPVILRDLHSTHGTWIGSRKIDADYFIQDGEMVKFGMEITAGTLRYDPHIFLVETEWQNLGGPLTPEASSPVSEKSKFVVPENTDDSDNMHSDIEEITPLETRPARSDHSGESVKSRNSSLSRNFEVPYSDEEEGYQASSADEDADEDAEGSIVDEETDYSSSSDEEEESTSLAEASNMSVASSRRPESLATKPSFEVSMGNEVSSYSMAPAETTFGYNHYFFKAPQFGRPPLFNSTTVAPNGGDDDVQEIPKSVFDAMQANGKSRLQTQQAMNDPDCDSYEEYSTEESDFDEADESEYDPVEVVQPPTSIARDQEESEIIGDASALAHHQDKSKESTDENDPGQLPEEDQRSFDNVATSSGGRGVQNIESMAATTNGPNSNDNTATVMSSVCLIPSVADTCDVDINTTKVLLEATNGREPSPSDAAMAKSYAQKDASWPEYIPPPPPARYPSFNPNLISNGFGRFPVISPPLNQPVQPWNDEFAPSREDTPQAKYTEGPFASHIEVTDDNNNNSSRNNSSTRQVSINDIINKDVPMLDRRELKRKADAAGLYVAEDDNFDRPVELSGNGCSLLDYVVGPEGLGMKCDHIPYMDSYVPMAQRPMTPMDDYEYIPMAQQASDSAIFREAALHPIPESDFEPSFAATGTTESATERNLQQLAEALKEPLEPAIGREEGSVNDGRECLIKSTVAELEATAKENDEAFDMAGAAFSDNCNMLPDGIDDLARRRRRQMQNIMAMRLFRERQKQQFMEPAGSVDELEEASENISTGEAATDEAATQTKLEPPRKKQKTEEPAMTTHRHSHRRGFRRFMGKLVPFMAGAAATATVIFGAAGALISTMPEEIQRQARREMGG